MKRPLLVLVAAASLDAVALNPSRPEPLTPPPGVEQPVAVGNTLGVQAVPLKPKEVGLIEPVIAPVTRAPENAFRMGAIVQPLRMCPAALSLNCLKFVL